MKKIVLAKGTHDQSIQQIRQIMAFPGNQTLVIGVLFCLFAPSAASLQTRSFFGAVHIHRLKPCYLN